MPLIRVSGRSLTVAEHWGPGQYRRSFGGGDSGSTMTTLPAFQQHPNEAECRALLKRIIDSKEFQRATKLREFLTYAVECKFAEASQELTESLIGHRVFHRSPTYNTGEDSIVRTEARILRQRLEIYFNGSGIGEQIILEIPKGGYIPVFRFRGRPAQQEIPPDKPA